MTYDLNDIIHDVTQLSHLLIGDLSWAYKSFSTLSHIGNARTSVRTKMLRRLTPTMD